MLVNKKLIKQVYKTTENLFAANRSKVKIDCYCYLNVRIHKFSWKQKFFVCDNLAWNLILGIPYITDTKLVIDLYENQIYFPYDVNNKINLLSILPDKVVYNVNSEIQIGNTKYKDQIYKLVNSNKNVFTKEIGQALNYEIELKLIDTEVVKLRPYPLSPPALKQVKEITDNWLKQGIIRPSMSKYSSPCFLVSKGDKPRLVINYNVLNSKIDKLNYPIGELHQCYNFLQGAKYFTVFDLSQSFLQIPLAQNSQHLTAFSTMYQSFEFLRLPYGLNCGSGVLSSFMDRVLGETKHVYSLNFIDDVICYSKTEEEHLIHLKDIVNRLGEHNLTVNPDKTKFFNTEISFLGHLIKENTISIDPSRTNAIRDCKIPRNVKEVSRFIGMVNYFSKFISNYASICSPLNDLRKKKVKFNWSETCQTAFERLKYCISNPPVLHLPDFEKEFILMTDASEYGVGGCLMQELNGNRVPIGYHSQKLNSSQLAWTIFEKECYACISSFNKFNQFLQLKPFLLITDNQALAFVLSTKRKVGKLARWVAQLMSMPFYIQHCKSQENPVSDCLSRLYDRTDYFENKEEDRVIVNVNNTNVIKNEYQIKPVSNVNIVTNCSRSVTTEQMKSVNTLLDVPLAYDSIEEHQSKDIEIINILNSIKNKTNSDKFHLQKGVVMYKKNDKSKPKIYIPEGLFNMLFKYYHETTFGGHLGYKRTIDKLTKMFYHPKLFKVIKEKVQSCELCKFAKPANKYYQGQLIATHAENIMDRCYIDLLGPYVRTKQGHTMILIVLDDYSKYIWLFPLREGKARSVINKLRETIFPNHSTCRSIVSDNASIFRSTEFRNFIFKYGIEHRRLAPYRPSGNRAERYISNVKNQLKCFYWDNMSNWDQTLGDIQICLNTAVNESTGFCAFELMYSYTPNHGLSNIWKIKDLLDTSLSREEIRVKLKSAICNVKKSVLLNKNRSRYSQNNVKHPFVVGSKVTLKTHYQSNKLNRFTNKLSLRFQGIFKILYFITPVTCLIQCQSDLNDVKKVHIGELKLL